MLRRFRGIAVVVSHDRGLLDTLPSAIVRIHAKRVTVQRGAWTQASRAWQTTPDEAFARACGSTRIDLM